MTPREALTKLRGSLDDKFSLFDFFISKSRVGALEDWELGMLETLKNELKPKARVVEMQASLKGVGGAEI